MAAALANRAIGAIVGSAVADAAGNNNNNNKNSLRDYIALCSASKEKY